MMGENHSDCLLCRDKLQLFIEGKLPEWEKEWVGEHLSVCDDCFSLYFEMIERKVVEEEKEHYLLGRSVLGLVSTPNPKVEEQAERIFRKLIEFGGKRGVSLVLIEAEPEQEREALLMQLKVMGRLREQGVEPIFCSSERLPEVLSRFDQLSSPIYYIFAQGFTPLAQLEEVFGTLEARKGSLVALLVVERGQPLLPLRSSLFTLPFRPSEELMETYINEEIESRVEKPSDPILRDAFKYVCLLDAWGVSSPLPLVARLTGTSEGKLKSVIDTPPRLIFRREDDPSFLTTRGSLMARKLLNSLIPEENIPEVCVQLIRVLSDERQEERRCILSLLQRWMEEGSRSWAKKVVKESWDDLRRIWRSGTPQEILLWGKLLGELKLFEESEEIFEHGLKLYPENLFILHAYAKMLGDWAAADERIKEKKAGKARELFRKATEIERDNAYTYQAWGHMEAELGKYTEAERRLEKALEIDPDNVFVLVAYGGMRADTGDYGEAERFFREAISIDPENIHAYTAYGDLLARRLRFSEAEEQFRRALEIDPRSFVTYNAWGVMLLRRGHWGKAGKLLEKALKIYPENTRSLHAFAELLTERKKYDKAREYFQKIVKLEEPYVNIKTLVAMAIMEGKSEDYERAEELFRLAQEVSPENARLFASWGEMLLRKGDLTEAEKFANRAWDIDYRTPAIRNIRAKLLAATGRLEEARTIFKSTVRYARYLDLIITYNTWAGIEENAGNLKDAEELHRKALNMDSENTYTLENYARVLEKMGNLEEAREYIEKARRLREELTRFWSL